MDNMFDDIEKDKVSSMVQEALKGLDDGEGYYHIREKGTSPRLWAIL